MLRRSIRKSLTVRIFVITVLVLLGAGTITFGLIAWATPKSYTAVLNDDLTKEVQRLVDALADTSLAESGPVLEDFRREAGADVMLVGPDDQLVNAEASSQGETAPAITYATDVEGDDEAVTVTTADQATITAEVMFSDQSHAYTLYVTPHLEAENVAVRALIQMAPWVLLTLVLFSFLGAFVYSRYITRPIVQLSGIAGKMAELDFDWKCEESREDEIGHLGHSLNEMALKLSQALRALKASNEALRGEVEQERELDRQRMAFFAAASHELKTPLTILQGHLSGMLDGIGGYQDREKYLLRALQMTARMEHLIQEILTVSRMEAKGAAVHAQVDLSRVLNEQLAMIADLLEQKQLHVHTELAPALSVRGETAMLAKAIGNLLLNAALYSPSGAHIFICSGLEAQVPTLTIENSGVHIGEEALPHLFDAFYREERSRNRATGGSGLGLYLVRIILERHGATCEIDNTDAGVRATVRFEDAEKQAHT